MVQNLMSTTPPARDDGYQGVQVLRKTITFADLATVVVIGKLPARAIILPDSGVHIVTAFNSSGDDLLDVGFKSGSSTDDPNGLGTAMLLSAIGFIPLDELGAVTNIMQTSEFLVTASPTQSVADATAGEAEIVICFVAEQP